MSKRKFDVPSSDYVPTPREGSNFDDFIRIAGNLNNQEYRRNFEEIIIKQIQSEVQVDTPLAEDDAFSTRELPVLEPASVDETQENKVSNYDEVEA